MPPIICDISKSKLADGHFCLPPGVFPICQTCWDGYPNACTISDEQTDESIHSVVVHVLEETILTINLPILKLNNTEMALHSHYQRSLVVVGYPESNDAAGMASLFNQILLLALGMPPWFLVARAYRLGSVHPDGSPRFCKLDLESILACDELLVKARNLKGQPGFAGIQLCPVLTPGQHQRK